VTHETGEFSIAVIVVVTLVAFVGLWSMKYFFPKAWAWDREYKLVPKSVAEWLSPAFMAFFMTWMSIDIIAVNFTTLDRIGWVGQFVEFLILGLVFLALFSIFRFMDKQTRARGIMAHRSPFVLAVLLYALHGAR